VIIIIAKEVIGTTLKTLAFDNAYRLLRAGRRRQYIRTIYTCVCVQNTPTGSFTRERTKKRLGREKKKNKEAASTFNNDVGIKGL
jgi:hypothetical protein